MPSTNVGWHRAALCAALIAGLGAALGGCESTPTVAAPVEARPGAAGAGGASGGASSKGAGVVPQSQVTGVDLTGAGGAGAAGAALLAGPRVIYFDYDSFAIKDQYQAMIEAQAKALATNRKAHLVIEGHTDERGGSEYNLALGQKRAEAVLRVLVLLGAPANELEAVSFGQERPAVEGHDEAAWAKNRRAELKDQ